MSSAPKPDGDENYISSYEENTGVPPGSENLVAHYQPKPLRNLNERLSMNFGPRLQLAFLGSFFSGAFMGISRGGQTAAFRYRAENAHRLPTSEKGWYFYHKSKNYHTILGGTKEGVRMGFKMGFWVSSFVIMEDAVDQWRGAGKRKDFLSTTAAGLGTSGIFSLWNRFPLTTAARTARRGLWIGLGYGLLQDVASLLQGRRVGYVDFLKSLVTENGHTSESTNV